MFIPTVGSCIKQKSFVVSLRALVHTLGRVGLEISVVLKQEGAPLNVQVLPFSLGPVRQGTGVVVILDVIWPGFLGPGFQGQGLVTLGGGPEMVGAGRV